jgi:hypothetical protein
MTQIGPGGVGWRKFLRAAAKVLPIMLSKGYNPAT